MGHIYIHCSNTIQYTEINTLAWPTHMLTNALTNLLHFNSVIKDYHQHGSTITLGLIYLTTLKTIWMYFQDSRVGNTWLKHWKLTQVQYINTSNLASISWLNMCRKDQDDYHFLWATSNSCKKEKLPWDCHHTVTYPPTLTKYYT